MLAAVLDTAFGGDDQPIAFGDRPAVRAARAEPDPAKMAAAFARIVAEFMQRSAAILNVLATAAQVDPEAAELLAQIRRQRYTGQSRIVAALHGTGALDPDLDTDEADDIVTPCCPRRCTGSSPSSTGGPPTATNAGSRVPSARSCAPASLRLSSPDRPRAVGPCCRESCRWPDREGSMTWADLLRPIGPGKFALAGACSGPRRAGRDFLRRLPAAADLLCYRSRCADGAGQALSASPAKPRSGRGRYGAEAYSGRSGQPEKVAGKP